MPAPASPRIAILGFSIECNKFAPPATKAHFLADTYLEGDDIVTEARAPTPTMLPETPGFVAAMDAAGPWQPVGIALAMAEPNGPVVQLFRGELVQVCGRGHDMEPTCLEAGAAKGFTGPSRGTRDRSRYRSQGWRSARSRLAGSP